MVKPISDADYLKDLARCLDPLEAPGSAKGVGVSDAKRLRVIASKMEPTKPSIDLERADFERWVIERACGAVDTDDLTHRGPGGGYTHPEVQSRWDGWYGRSLLQRTVN